MATLEPHDPHLCAWLPRLLRLVPPPRSCDSLATVSRLQKAACPTPEIRRKASALYFRSPSITTPLNPYASPTYPGPRSRKLDRGVLGLRWGLVFALPVIGFDILGIVETVAEPTSDLRENIFKLATLGLLALAAGAIVLSGYWWAQHAPRLKLPLVILAAVAQGSLWMTMFMAGGLGIRGYRNHWSWNSLKWNIVVPLFAIGCVICSIWFLLLGLTIRGRLSRAYKKRLALRRKAVPVPSV